MDSGCTDAPSDAANRNDVSTSSKGRIIIRQKHVTFTRKPSLTSASVLTPKCNVNSTPWTPWRRPHLPISNHIGWREAAFLRPSFLLIRFVTRAVSDGDPPLRRNTLIWKLSPLSGRIVHKKKHERILGHAFKRLSGRVQDVPPGQHLCLDMQKLD